ncbi:hypothetical protein B5C34_07035 [Pacificimonas flava]|uniref:Ice-binding protein C-terminal domain-containing protein n=2 Tax=Pacificimonas TaxID=1960290 RepID=A0A219B551_9SPHN|nr:MULTISPECIES: PEP-CTERM sorting domain-containing protein [Pacificimonas]MBZ6377021.1 pre-peptidase C-terminal domain-containing protein [Pacificimonas aurantium]OWV33236.1 hypothetical protein B5C34_07035 [Pacificimonas flava]
MFKKVLVAVPFFLSFPAAAGIYVEAEITGGGNDSFLTAESIDAEFSLAFNEDIADSTTIPYVSITASAEDGGVDIFSFFVSSPRRGIFDVDYAAIESEGSEDGPPMAPTSYFDSWLNLYDGLGNLLASADDSDISDGALGSASSLDSFLTYDFTTSGLYYIEVKNYSDAPFNIQGGDPQSPYALQVSLAPQQVPAPGALGLLGLGALALGLRRRTACTR